MVYAGRAVIPLSVLDQSPIAPGATPRAAIEATIALAKRCEELGYRRYWLAEHHASNNLADASPEILLARLTAETSRIRLGTGGIMLPHYSSFKVAESFRMLEALAPGRIDLGVGRAPGGTRLASAALESRNPALFPQQVVDTIGFLERTLEPDHPLTQLWASPAGDTMPEVWLLGSSDYGALLAAQLGLPYSFAHFIGGDYPEITRAYRERFQPSHLCAEPHAMITVSTVVAPTDAEAERLALPGMLSRLRRHRGIQAPFPTIEEAEAYPWTPQERYEAEQTRRVVTGSPETVRARLEALVREYAVDELMVLTVVPDYAARERSYELLAEAMIAPPLSSRT
jgi:luciferase family oxidoreductase group 1